MFDAKKLRAKMKSKKLSAAKLAEILDTTKENVYKWRNGTKPSDYKMGVKIENWLKGAPKIEKSNGIDWQKKYYDLLEKYTALLERMK